MGVTRDIDISLVLTLLTLIVSIITLVITFMSYMQPKQLIKLMNKYNFDVFVTKSSEFEFVAPIHYCDEVKSTFKYIDGDVGEVFLDNNRYYCFNIRKDIELKEAEYLISCSRYYNKIYYTSKYKKYKKQLIKK